MFTRHLAKSILRRPASCIRQQQAAFYSRKNMAGLGVQQIEEEEAMADKTRAPPRSLEEMTSQELGTHMKQKLVEYNKANPRIYLGYTLSYEDNMMLSLFKLGTGLRKWLDRFFISPSAPAHFSISAADLWTRIQISWDVVIQKNWFRMIDPQPYEEMLNCKSQFARDSKSFTEEERTILADRLNKLEAYWELALKVESITGLLDSLKEKYRNAFVFPDEDVKLLYAIVEEHFALVEKVNTEKMFSDNSALLAQKISDSVIADVLFLKEKMIIPELSLKYPSLFK